MKTLAWITAFLAICAIGDGAVMICQYASWAVYRVAGGKFGPDDIDPNLCTHGVYVTAGLDNNDNVVSLDPWADLTTGGGMGGYQKFTNLKQINPDFKAILALGGWASASLQYGAIAADPARRASMAESLVNFLKQYKFDGVEIDWLYPATVNEKDNFPLLLADIRSAFEPEGFEILVTVGALEVTIENSYDLAAMEQHVDYMVMIGYDYEGAWNPWTGHTTPLYVESALCVDATVTAYLTRGVTPGKLVLGFPGFGRTWTLADESNSDVGAPAIGAGDSGPYTGTPGILNYNEIVEDIDNGWTVERDPISQSAWAHRGNQWLSLDDGQSATFKAQYAANKGLAGAAIWTIDNDNFAAGAFTLVRAINDGFAKQKL